MKIDRGQVRTALLNHHDRHRRTLPWRGEADPYRILVSEVMLQQTRVETVLGYYGSWLERFPDVASLAAADEESVLKAWEGLGYYRRAKNLHAAARMVRDRWAGRLPETEEGLRSLPGVGAYTAGAVASIAFGAHVPAVDGNVRRVLARLFDVAEPSAGWLRTTAAALVDPERPGDWNEAIMELGATVCTPRSPRCDRCPVSSACAARAAGTERERPVSSRRPAPRLALIALAVLVRGDGVVYLERRGDGGLLAGMWALPEREIDAESSARDAAIEVARERLGLVESGERLRARPLQPLDHRFTHLLATYLPWIVEVDVGYAPVTDPAEACWADREARAALPIPVAQRSVLGQV